MSNDLFNNSPRQRLDVTPSSQGVNLSDASMNLSSFRNADFTVETASQGTVSIHPKHTVGCNKEPDAELSGLRVSLPGQNVVLVTGQTPAEFAALERA
jgi:hypothetical protein